MNVMVGTSESEAREHVARPAIRTGQLLWMRGQEWRIARAIDNTVEIVGADGTVTQLARTLWAKARWCYVTSQWVLPAQRWTEGTR